MRPPSPDDIIVGDGCHTTMYRCPDADDLRSRQARPALFSAQKAVCVLRRRAAVPGRVGPQQLKSEREDRL